MNIQYERATELLEADLGDELVALDERQGNCFGFNAVATSVWKMLQEPRSFEVLKRNLLEEFDVGPKQCESELRVLLQEMTARGLLRQSNGTGAA